MRDHLLRTSGLAWFAYCSARKLAPNHYGLKHAQQAVLSNIVAAYFLQKRKEATPPQYHPVSTRAALLGANSGANSAPAQVARPEPALATTIRLRDDCDDQPSG